MRWVLNFEVGSRLRSPDVRRSTFDVPSYFSLHDMICRRFGLPSFIKSQQQFTMIQRSLFRQSRQVSSRLRCSSNLSPSTSYFTSLRITPPPLRQRIALRCYSTATEEKPSANSEASPAEQSQPGIKEEEDPAKKKLDAKHKEVIELKVSPPPHPPFQKASSMN